MKHLVIAFSLLTGILSGCGATRAEKPQTEVADTVAEGSTSTNGVLPNTVIMFSETTDKNFCDTEQFLAGDCNGGMLYFTEKGNVIREWWCFGSDTTTYSVGTYTTDAGDITCSFDQRYSFYNGYVDMDEEEKPHDPNSGKLKKLVEPYAITLLKLNCPDYLYGIRPEGDDYPSVVFAADTAQSGPWMRGIKKIKAFEGL